MPCSVVGSPRVTGAVGAPAPVGLSPGVAVTTNFGVELLGERVDDGHADAVETSGNLVAAALAELASGMQNGENDLERGLALLLHGGHGDAGTVVDHGHGVVGMDRDLNGVVTARQGLVDRVVNNLVDKVMQAAESRGADVHARSFADGLEALQNLDVFGVVRLLLTI